ncbi:cytochrome P450 [Mycena sp. CBHHK59/15]|nr:cytochrome P450 [Mycena sp. CBHHK59/15]
MVLPPGLRFVAHNLLAPLFSILLIQGVATHAPYGFGWSVWVVPVTSLHIVTEKRQSREAEAMGARLAPRAKGKWPGNIDLLRSLLAAYETGYLGDGLYELVEELGPVFNTWLLWDNLIFTVAPEHIQIILATDFKNYVKGKRFRDAMDSVLGNGVFNSDGEMWSFHRSMTRPYFTRDRVQHFEIFDRHAERAISLVRGRMKEGTLSTFKRLRLGLQDLISRFTMDSATEFLFGACVDSLSATLPYPHNAPANRDSSKARAASDFTAAFSTAMLQIAFRERVGWVWPLFEMFADHTAGPMGVVDEYLDPIIRAAMEKKTRGGVEWEGGADGESDTLLDELLKSTSDPKLLKDEILAMYPAVTARLRDEILRCAGPTRLPTHESIKQMKYLRAVLNGAPFNVRETVQATTWPSPDPNEKPIYIPAGVKIPYSVMIMQRRKDLWGPDADVFDPDRFLDERVQKYLLSNPFQFLPFNAGPRICLGQQFAYNEMSFMIIRLLQNFSAIALDNAACPPHTRVPDAWRGHAGRKGVERFWPKAHLTMYTSGGLWVRMGEA